jgi:hypothetical protein
MVSDSALLLCSKVRLCIVLLPGVRLWVVLALWCQILRCCGSPVSDSVLFWLPDVRCYGSPMSDTALLWLPGVRFFVVVAPQCQILRCYGAPKSDSALLWLPGVRFGVVSAPRVSDSGMLWLPGVMYKAASISSAPLHPRIFFRFITSYNNPVRESL